VKYQKPQLPIQGEKTQARKISISAECVVCHFWFCLLITLAFPFLASTGFAQSSVSIAWNANPEPDVVGYNVHLGTTSNFLTVNQTVTTSAAKISNLTPSTTYFLAVQAYNSQGIESALSSQISFTTRPPEPEITVKNAAGSSLVDGVTTVPAGAIQLGDSATQSFTILNEGTSTLNLIAISADGPHAHDFVISSPLLTSLAPKTATTFTVTLAPTVTGTRSAAFRIASNDVDESSFDVALSGSAGTDTQLYTQWATANQLSGPRAPAAATPFNDGVMNLIKYAFNLNAAGPDLRVLPKGNGTVGLPLFYLDRSGPQPFFTVEFLRRKNSGLIYKPKISTNLATFEPMTGTTTETSIGVNWERVIIRKPCDPETTPQIFGFVEVMLPETPTIPAPEIAVLNSVGTGMKSATAAVPFGPVYIESPAISKSLTITNEGSANLTGLVPTIDGLQSADFSVSPLELPTLAPGESVNLTVTFLPSTTGLRNATLQIASNDANESPFSIALSATVMTATELFSDWAADADLNATNTHAFATPFNDGVPNLLKYAFNLNPGGPDTRTLIKATGIAGLPITYLDRSGARPLFTTEFLRRKNSGLIYVAKISSDLSTFTPATGTTTLVDISTTWERVIIRTPCDPALTPQLFGRVDVTLP
jgi:hypothetical protein